MIPAALRVLASVFGLPCWQVRWDGQVGLDMNFGAPRLSIRQPRASSSGSTRVRAQMARRGVHLHGTHWLLVGPGTWRLELADGLAVRDSSSAKRLDMAVARLNGEILEGIRMDGASGTTLFLFDLGSRLLVRGGSGAPHGSELWSLNDRSHSVEVYMGGQYACAPVKRAVEQRLPLGPESVIVARSKAARRRLEQLRGRGAV